MPDDVPGSFLLVSVAPATTQLPNTTATRIENLPPGTVAERMEIWQRRLLAARSPLPALDAYTGDGWQQLRAGYDACNVPGKELWIASPGLGLIPAHHPLSNYSAVFSPGHADQIGRDDDEMQRWWEALNQWNTQSPGMPNGLAGLAKAMPAATMMVVLSNDALSALHADLWEARESLAEPDKFLVLAGGPPSCLGLGASLLRIDTRFERLLGGPRHTVPQRMARHLLESFTPAELHAPFLQTWLKQLSWRLPKQETKAKPPGLKKLSSVELDHYVRRELTANPRLKPASLRRMLRESERTCDPKLLDAFYLRHALPLLQKPSGSQSLP